MPKPAIPEWFDAYLRDLPQAQFDELKAWVHASWDYYLKERGRKGGNVTAKRGPDYYRQIASQRKIKSGGRPKKGK